MSCDHELSGEYLYPSDADVLAIEDGNAGLVIHFALSCPECGQALELEAGVSEVTESDLDLPLDDEMYD